MLLSIGCLAMLSDLAPGGCVARADVAGPTYIHRLHRVGYEVLAEPGSIEWFAQKIEVGWQKNSWNGSEEHAKNVLVEVLKDDSELRSACAGIPLELIVDRYLVTEQWYNQGRNSFLVRVRIGQLRGRHDGADLF